MKADPVHPMFIWILECKDYESRNVNVDEVEEFHHKIQQVGAHKGLIFTRHGFATGAIEVARTHKIGLSILKRGKVMLLEASATGGLFWVDEIEASFWLTSEGTEKSASFSEVLRRELHKFDILILPVKRNKRRVLKEELTNNNTESNEP